MKSYQTHLLEILMYESGIQDKSLLASYKKLFEEILDPQHITESEIFESLDFLSSSMTTKRAVIEPLLKKEILPYMVFLVCSN